jgi:hypothetical protein
VSIRRRVWQKSILFAQLLCSVLRSRISPMIDSQKRGKRPVAMIRCFRACLLTLFLAAQVAGVVPLILDHTMNVFETAPVTGDLHIYPTDGVTAPDADHHHGILDLHDQCCALHTLAGPIPQMTNLDLVVCRRAHDSGQSDGTVHRDTEPHRPSSTISASCLSCVRG